MKTFFFFFSQLHLSNTPLPAISLFLEERFDKSRSLYVVGSRPMFLLIGAVSIFQFIFFTSAKKLSTKIDLRSKPWNTPRACG